MKESKFTETHISFDLKKAKNYTYPGKLGILQIHVPPRRERLKIHPKLTYRIYKELGLAITVLLFNGIL